VAGHHDRFVGGESALAGFWFHHRQVRHLEVVLPDQAALEAMQQALSEQPSQTCPGFARYEIADLTVDHMVVLDPEKPEEHGIRADSLRDLAADRMLRLATKADADLLLDLYFLHRARVDLSKAVEDAARKDLGLTASALSVVLARAGPVMELPPGVVRPVDLADWNAFLTDLVMQFGMQIRF
jgi:hypothetical protein